MTHGPSEVPIAWSLAETDRRLEDFVTVVEQATSLADDPQPAAYSVRRRTDDV